MIQLVLITGVSGAGKSSALYYFEENGYYVTDNLPIEVIPSFFETIISQEDKYKKVAVAVGAEIAEKAFEIAKKHQQFTVQFIGLDCEKAELLSRYRLSRKKHPKEAYGESLEEAVDKEKELLQKMRLTFTDYIDTSKLSKNEFRHHLITSVMMENGNEFSVTFFSFGYKKAVPQDVETVFDVRLLPNPYWVPELRELTGLDPRIEEYVMSAKETKEFLVKVCDYLDYYLANVKESGRHHANIGIACSGGQHRSVVIAEYLNKKYSKKYHCEVIHKDLPK